MDNVKKSLKGPKDMGTNPDLWAGWRSSSPVKIYHVKNVLVVKDLF